MNFMMMMNSPGKGAFQIGEWPRKDILAHMEFMKSFYEELVATGVLVDAQGLAGPDQAKLVRASPDGTPITDGVFAETKEFLAGYWIVEVETPEQAYALAAKASTAPGVGGEPLYLPIEVRQVMSRPPDDGAP